jgi:hypothetical protein
MLINCIFWQQPPWKKTERVLKLIRGEWRMTGKNFHHSQKVTAQVAQAPKVHVTQNMQSLLDLESNGLQSVKSHLADRYGAHIDFTTLLSVLLPEEQLVENNDVWDEDLLLTEVVSELELGKENEQWGS